MRNRIFPRALRAGNVIPETAAGIERRPGESAAHLEWRKAVANAPLYTGGARGKMKAAALRRRGRAGLGAIDVTIDPTAKKPWYADFGEKALAIYQSISIAETNKKRLAQGLPPLTDAEIRKIAPAANVTVQLPPEIKAAIVGGVVFLGVLLITRMPRRR